MGYNWDDGLDEEKEGSVRNSVGREHSEHTKRVLMACLEIR